MAGKRVFICAAPQDSGYYVEIVAALDAWHVAHTEIGIPPEPGFALPPQIERAIGDCEVFLRLCTTHTKQSSAVNLATQYFSQLLTADRQRGKLQRRKLVNLILDPAYPLDEEERKTLYIMTQDKARVLWLEELAAPVGVATLKQQISRRAVLGMGIGATLTLASASAAGVLLYQQKQAPPLSVTKKISGNPKYIFRLSNATTFNYARVIRDGSTIYAQPDLKPTDSAPRADSSVYVLSPSDGKQRKIEIVTNAVMQFTFVAASQGTLFLYFNDYLDQQAPPNPSRVWAVNASDGKMRWSINSFTAGAPILENDSVYSVLSLETSRTPEVVTAEYSLNAFSAKDGALLWRNSDINLDDLNVPTVASGRLYIGTQDHHVSCLDAKTGKVLWSYLTRGPVRCTPLVSGGIVYVGSTDGQVYALDAASGTLRWHFATSGPVVATPLLYEGAIYVASQDAYIYALDAKAGAMYWRAYVGANPVNDNLEVRQIENTLSAYRNVLFATVYGGLYAFEVRDGTQRWRYIPVEENVATTSAPVIGNGLAFVGAADNRVYAVNP